MNNVDRKLEIIEELKKVSTNLSEVNKNFSEILSILSEPDKKELSNTEFTMKFGLGNSKELDTMIKGTNIFIEKLEKEIENM